MKKLTSLILALALVLAFAVPAFAAAETATVVADSGWTNATYDSETQILTDEDTGVSFKWTGGNSLAYNGTDPIVAETVVIPSSVNGVAITTLSSRPFGTSGVGVKYLTLSEGIVSTPKPCFSGYSSLVTVQLPSTFTSLGDETFRNCSNLTSINIPTGVTKISSLCFAGCGKLESIELHDGITTIAQGAFNQSGFKSFVFPAGVTSFPKEAVKQNTQCKTIVIKGNVTSIGDSAFRNETSLETLTFEGTTAPAAANINSTAFSGTTANNFTVYYPANGVGYDDPDFRAKFPSGVTWRILNVPFVTAGDVDTALDNVDPADNAIVSWATITFPDYVAGYQYGIVAYEGEGDFDATTSGATLYRALGHKDGIYGVKLIGDLVTSAIRTRTYMFDGTNYTYGD